MLLWDVMGLMMHYEEVSGRQRCSVMQDPALYLAALHTLAMKDTGPRLFSGPAQDNSELTKQKQTRVSSQPVFTSHEWG